MELRLIGKYTTQKWVGICLFGMAIDPGIIIIIKKGVVIFKYVIKLYKDMLYHFEIWLVFFLVIV